VIEHPTKGSGEKEKFEQALRDYGRLVPNNPAKKR